MKTRNRCAKLEYYVLCYAISVLSMGIYLMFLRELPFCSYVTSRIIFIFAVTISMLIEMLIKRENDRNLYSIISSLSLVIGVYTVLANMRTYPIMIAGILFIFSVVLIAIRRRIKEKYKFRANINYITRATTKAMLSATCIISVIAIGIGNSFLVDNSFTVREKTETEMAKINQEQQIEGKLSFLKQFYEATWVELAKDDRMQAIKALCEYEKKYLGITMDLQVSFENLAGRHILGRTSPQNGTIMIDENYLTDNSNIYCAHGAMNTVIHEMFHIYEKELIDLSKKLNEDEKKLLKFNSVDDYLLESKNYNSGSHDFEEYYNQSLEKDSRAYARLRVNEYYFIIENQLPDEEEK